MTVALQFEGLSDKGWTIESAEELLGSLKGVISVRIVARPGGRIEEIHVLTTDTVSPKATVRNVESALKAHFQLEVDHRIISVAQSSEPVVERPPEPQPETPRPGPHLMESVGPDTLIHGQRILFVGHQVQTERGRRAKVAVMVEWQGEEFTGEATGTDLPRSRLETVANATLSAVERAIQGEGEEPRHPGLTLALDGVKAVDAFDRNYMLVSVNAIYEREVAELAGAGMVEDTPERAVILATLQAIDRWVRGRL